MVSPTPTGMYYFLVNDNKNGGNLPPNSVSESVGLFIGTVGPSIYHQLRTTNFFKHLHTNIRVENPVL